MNVKLKPPCWVVDIQSGRVLRCRSLSRPSRRMQVETGWKGLVAHVQNERGTGIVEYRKLRKPTLAELAALENNVRQRFGIPTIKA